MTIYHPEGATLDRYIDADGEQITVERLIALRWNGGDILLEDGSAMFYSRFDKRYAVCVYNAQVAPKI